MSRLRSPDDDDDGGLPPSPSPRPPGSRNRSHPGRSMGREASDHARSPPAAPSLRREEDFSSSSQPGRPSRKKDFTSPGVFKPTSSSGPRERDGRSISPKNETSAFLKTAVFKPGSSAMKEKSATKEKTKRRIGSAMKQNSDSELKGSSRRSGRSAMKQDSMRSVGSAPAETPRSALRKKRADGTRAKLRVSIDDSEHSKTRRAVKFVYPAKAEGPPEKAAAPLELAPPRPVSPPSPERYAQEEDENEGGSERDLKRVMSNASIIDDRNKLETRWNWTRLLISHAFKPYRKALSENDDLLPDPDELAAFDAKDSDDEEQRYIDEVRDQMLDDGQLSEREIAAFFSGFTLFNAKVKSLQSQLESAKTMAFQKVAPSATAVSKRSLADYRSRSISDFGGRQANKRVVADERRSSALLATKGNASANSGLSCKSLSIRRIQHDPKTSPEHQRLLKELEDAEKKQKKLEKQIKQAGLQIAEDIPYEEAKEEVSRIAARMQEIGSSEVTHPDKQKQAELREEYFKLEQDMEKFSTALMLTDEYIEEQEEKEMTWEKKNEGPNNEALKKLRRHMPVEVKSMSEADLCTKPTPNGKYLPKAIAKKFKRTNVLQLIRTNPEDIARMHPSTLENMRVTGMTLTERRAMYAHLKDVGPRWKAMQADAMTERKWTWYTMMRTNFKETLEQYEYHVEQYGPPGNHPYASRANPKEGCPMIGKQCPLRADQQPSYDDDYGYTEEAEYEVTIVKKADVDDPGAKAASDAAALAREKRATERLDALKKHYKGVLQVSLANGSCENMDESLDTMEALQVKWFENAINQGDEPVAEDAKRKEMLGLSDALNDLRLSVLQFAERSGMQLTGKRDANADKMDIRSALELGLCEEVCETANDFFSGIQQRMKELSVKDGRMKVAIEQLRELLDELHERNLKTLERLGVERPAPSRKRKTREAMAKEVKEKLQPIAEEAPEEEDDYGPTVSTLGGRGDLMSAIAGRGRGGGGGRGDLMSAIAGRGRGGPDGGGGRGDLMSAIAARGGRGGRDEGGGRGDLMSAIAARGGRGGRDGGGGRGDLMSAIAARGGRGGRSGRDGGGRGDLMSAIAARGSGRGGRSGRDGGGRGDLMSAIAARGGRGGRSGRDVGGRGDLMAAIAARGSGRGDSSSQSGGGRGDLMAAIAARGSGRGGRSGREGGRGDLNAAIAARGSGKSEERSTVASGGGRGNFLAEIQAKAAAREPIDGGS